MHFSSGYPDLRTADNELSYDQLEEVLHRLLKENEFISEEIIVAENFLKHNQSTGSAISRGYGSQGEHQADDDNNSDNSDGASGQVYIKKKTKKRRGNTPQYHLSLDNKIEMVSKEMEAIRSAIQTENREFDQEIENMRAQVQEADQEIEEVGKEHFEFDRDVSNPETGALNPRNGKLVAEKVLKYFDDKLKQRDALLDKLRLKISTYKSQVKKAKQQLEQREEMGDVLSKIDFDQLKIENDQMTVKIDERNDELIRLKLTTGKTLQILTALMDKLNKLTSHTIWLKKQIDARENSLDTLKSEIEKVLKDKDKEGRKNTNLIQQHEKVKVPEILDYVKLKAELDVVRKEVTNWERKLEIASMNEKTNRQKVISIQKSITS
ncbi:coiled-coil domain-containing protein [Acrasis kona]